MSAVVTSPILQMWFDVSAIAHFEVDDVRTNLGDGPSDVETVNGPQIRHDEAATRVAGYKVERAGHNST